MVPARAPVITEWDSVLFMHMRHITCRSSQIVRPERQLLTECMKNIVNRITLLLCITGFLVGCATKNAVPRIQVYNNQSWVLLPVENLSQTPQAGRQAAIMLESSLRKRGVSNLTVWQEEESLTLKALLDTSAQVSKASEWGARAGARYGLTGTVHEWHYRSDPEREPAVGVSLKMIDLQSGDVLWQATHARTGWGYSSLSGIAGETLNELLDGIRFLDNSLNASL